ncbi:MAG: HutD family protein [Kiloniellaceae bacterium]
MPDSSTRRILTTDIEATPWKNGGGVTREIAAGGDPDGDAGGAQGWGWRVSLAEVAQDGPFSVFPDTDRVIAVIDGVGMDLVSPEGATIALEPFQPVRFAGEGPLSGRLRRGPVRDLNVMVRRSLFEAEMEVRHGPHSAVLKGDSRGCLLVHNLAGRCALRVDGGHPHDLMPEESLVHEGEGNLELQLAADGRAAVIRIAHRQQS